MKDHASMEYHSVSIVSEGMLWIVKKRKILESLFGNRWLLCFPHSLRDRRLAKPAQ